MLLPLSKAEHDIEAVRKALATPHAAIAVTSAEIARLFSTIGTDVAPRLSTRVFAVGQATADAMKAVGFHDAHAAGGDGEALAESIIAHVRVSGAPESPILYLAGKPRASGFENRLRAAGIPFRTVESYRMVALTYPRPPSHLHCWNRCPTRCFFIRRKVRVPSSASRRSWKCRIGLRRCVFSA